MTAIIHFDIDKIIRDSMDKHGLTSVKFTEDRSVKSNRGYLSVMRRFQVEGMKNGENVKRQIIVKIKPGAVSLGLSLPIDEYWLTELSLYGKVFPCYDLLQDKLLCKFKHPYCYNYDVKAGYIVLEDLRTRGYENCRLGKTLDYEHSLLLLQQIAYFHALSFLVKHRYPNKFQDFINLRRDRKALYYDFTIYLEGAVKFAMEKIKTRDFVYVMEKFKRFDCKEKAEYLLLGENHEYAVIAHGDLWANNLMYKYEGLKVISAMLLDYQLSFYRSPVTDLYFALFIAIDENVRESSFPELVAIYDNSFRRQLKDMGEDPEILYPRDTFLNDLKKFSYAGLCLALVNLPLFGNTDEDLRNVNNEEVKEKYGLFMGAPVASEMYISRVEQIGRDMRRHKLYQLW